MNLIQIQEAIKNVPIQNLMQYANGSNPDVPAYLATAELLRRRKLEESNQAGQAPQESLKDQLIKPMAQSVPQPTMSQPQANPAAQAPAQGVASLNTPGMFKQSSFAGGGIVAFAAPGPQTVGQAAEEQEESWWDKFKKELAPSGFKGRSGTVEDKYKYRGSASIPKTGTPPNVKTTPTISSVPAEAIGTETPFFSTETPAPAPVAAAPKKAASNGSASTNASTSATASSSAVSKAPEAGVPSVLNQEITPYKPMTFETPSLPPTLTAKEFRAKQLAEQNEFGVSQNPFADLERRYAAIEANRARDRAGESQAELRHLLSSFAQASPTAGLAGAGGAASEAHGKMVKENAALRHKEDLEMAQLQSAVAKEKDALRRGDLAAFHAAQKDRENAEFALAKLKVDQAQVNVAGQTAHAALQNASTNRADAAVRADVAYRKLPAEIQHLIDTGKAALKPNQIETLWGIARAGGFSPEKFVNSYIGQGKTGAYTFEEAFKLVEADPFFMGKPTEEKMAEAWKRVNGSNPSGNESPPAGAPKDARKAPDGKWYAKDAATGKYRVYE
ncbi:hypothetical protein UFOVP274_43 [uncultured Caudovirales phage]|uniref:Uncharacterized protein n=1 Tax=uncultured Caudovirales phage TaxID=2100421 RepID=A0A6J5LKE8_9CAUD|nr:hypothetical protein UFOVP274_43 [uncultured Caudovirales phage]